MKNQKSVFEFGDEFICTEFFDVDTQCGGVEVNRNGAERIGSILGLSIPDIEDEDGTKYILVNCKNVLAIKEQ